MASGKKKSKEVITDCLNGKLYIVGTPIGNMAI